MGVIVIVSLLLYIFGSIIVTSIAQKPNLTSETSIYMMSELMGVFVSRLKMP
jgi:hypothetical protein